MAEYLVPAGFGAAELVEKRSRFIGQVWRVDSEDEARGHIASVRQAHRDARHNCWCYLLRSGAARSFDDGEPQGTAGSPMLEVFRRGGVLDSCCVVTRYFGGVLLGAGGLTRAYGHAAKLALQAAGTLLCTDRRTVSLRCPYRLAARVKAEAERMGGSVEGAAYAADVTMRISVPESLADAFIACAAQYAAIL
ncbi:MAG: YigZ family protein [Oscillospiraceae bacterium]|jgi:uncharacterized YigZ family protein|nr:YigZ family protein [Oscillospiraceae bacterium]